MNQKKTRFRKLLLLPLLIAVLLFPTQALAVYSCTVQLPVEVKTITKTEDTEIPTGEVYTVVLTAEDDAPLPEETRLTVTDNGTVRPHYLHQAGRLRLHGVPGCGRDGVLHL